MLKIDPISFNGDEISMGLAMWGADKSIFLPVDNFQDCALIGTLIIGHK